MKFWYILSIFILSGCYSLKKADRQLNKAKITYPDLVAEKYSKWFGCDTITIVRDSIQFKEWVNEIHSFDTITDTIRLREKCPEMLVKYRNIIKRVPPIHDTIRVVNRVEVELYRDRYEKARSDNEKKDKWLMRLGLFLIFILLLLIFITTLKK